MNPRLKKQFVRVGAITVAAGTVGVAATQSILSVGGAAILIGGALIVEAYIVGRKPRG